MKLVNRVGQYLQPGRSWYKRNVAGITHLVVHHSVTYTQGKTNDQMVQELASIHWNKGWPGLSYNRVITPDGTVYQINNIDDLTWTDSHNEDSLAVCMIGYFHSPANMQPTSAQLKALKECLDEWSTQHPEFPADHDDVWGHRDRWSTACPGDLCYPYATEYRTKLGNVDWGSGSPAPLPPSGNCLLDNTEDNRKLYAKLVEGSTVRKEVAQYLEIPNPDNALTEAYTKVIGGFKSATTDSNNKLIEAEKKLAVSEAEVLNQKDKVANIEAKCQRDLEAEKARYDALKATFPDAAKIEGLYKGTIRDLEGKLREAQKAGGLKDLEIAELKSKVNELVKGQTKSLSLSDLLKLLLLKLFNK